MMSHTHKQITVLQGTRVNVTLGHGPAGRQGADGLDDTGRVGRS